MIDYHTHILPGIDDGSCNAAMSIAMLREEARLGIDTVYLTPHFYAEENSPAKFLERRAQAWQKLAENLEPGLPELRLGAEVQYFEGISGVAEISDLRMQDRGELLVEMPFRRWTDRQIREIADLNDREDIRVVLAHIERYMPMQERDVWDWLRRCGIKMQCNVSFFGSWKTRHRAMKMLRSGEIAYLGSDCHNTDTRCPNWDRLPGKARELAEDCV